MWERPPIASFPRNLTEIFSMQLDHAFRLSSILLAAISFASLGLALALPSWLLVLVCIAFSLALLHIFPAPLFSRLWPSLRISPVTWNIFLVLSFAGFWIDLLLFSQNILHAGVHFLILLLVNKLSNLDQRRDVLQLHAISLITLLASAALTTQVWYACIFFFYLVTAVWALLTVLALVIAVAVMVVSYRVVLGGYAHRPRLYEWQWQWQGVDRVV